jgi:hypothetical protein
MEDGRGLMTLAKVNGLSFSFSFSFFFFLFSFCFRGNKNKISGDILSLYSFAHMFN